MADRGFSHLAGIESIHQRESRVILRLNEQSSSLEWENGSPVVLGEWLAPLSQPGQFGGANIWVPVANGSGERIPARLCAVRKSIEATAPAERKLKRKASRRQTSLRGRTLENTAWIVVLTTVEQSVLNDAEVLEWYRVRWQIELAFKRLKSLGELGHLPKRDPVSSRAWVYGKLLIALLTEKMQRHAAAFSPWGGRWLEQAPPPEPLA